MLHTKIQIKQPTVKILIPVPSKKPVNAPSAALNAFFVSEESLINSPMSAPKNGPIKMKIGVRKNPTIRPIVQPQVAALLPPAFFVMSEGKILSMTVTTMAAIPVTTRIQIPICEYTEKCAARSPAQAIGGPGSAGTTVPISPTMRRKPARITKRIVASIYKSHHCAALWSAS